MFLGLGANLGDPLAQLAAAVAGLRGAVEVDVVSSVFRTEPVGFREQPDFFNLVVAGSTRLEPGELLRAVQEVEARMGRVRTFRDAPRRIDVDVLAYGDLVIDTPELTVPHPRMAARGFVLHPLAEIAPDWRHPVSGKTARQLLAGAVGLERVERVGPLPGQPGT